MKHMFRHILLLLVTIVFVTTSCKPKNEPHIPITPGDNSNEVNQYVNAWIYENMALYYFWNSNMPNNPDAKVKPSAFFDNILNKYNAMTNPDGDRFSWIQEDYVELLNSLSGVVSDEIGFEYVRVAVNESSPKQYYLLVLYPKKGTDAYEKGIKKGDFITKINGQAITDANYSQLTGGTGMKSLNIAKYIYNEEIGTYKLTNIVSPLSITMQKNFAENPVYMDSIYHTPKTSKSVGYMVYNFFARDSGSDDIAKKYEYDRAMLETLGKLQNQGINDFILDLRYNGGGAVSSSVALSSALVPNRDVSNLFSTTEYNLVVHNSLKKEHGEGYNKTYFIDAIKVSKDVSIEVPRMSLNKIYILVSMWTASASEMVINGLIPYFGRGNIILIGETTVGKNVGSISIYEEDDAKNKWGMQPIIAKYYNSAGNSDFTAGFVPDHEVDELGDGLRIVDFGDTSDLLLNKALTLINEGPLDDSDTELDQAAAQKKSILPLRVNKKSASILEKPGRNVLHDDLREEEIRKIFQ